MKQKKGVFDVIALAIMSFLMIGFFYSIAGVDIFTGKSFKDIELTEDQINRINAKIKEKEDIILTALKEAGYSEDYRSSFQDPPEVFIIKDSLHDYVKAARQSGHLNSKKLQPAAKEFKILADQLYEKGELEQAKRFHRANAQLSNAILTDKLLSTDAINKINTILSAVREAGYPEAGLIRPRKQKHIHTYWIEEALDKYADHASLTDDLNQLKAQKKFQLALRELRYLANILFVKGNIEKAVKIYSAGAELGDAKAASEVEKITNNVDGVTNDNCPKVFTRL